MSPKLAVNLGLDLSAKMWFFIFLMIGNLPLDCLHKESLWRQEKPNILGDACRGQEERKNEDGKKSHFCNIFFSLAGIVQEIPSSKSLKHNFFFHLQR